MLIFGARQESPKASLSCSISSDSVSRLPEISGLIRRSQFLALTEGYIRCIKTYGSLGKAIEQTVLGVEYGRYIRFCHE